MVKKHFFGLLLAVLALGTAHASHIVGGEISYKCLGFNGISGTYQIDMKIYRDCENGLPFFDNPAYLAIFGGSVSTTPYSVELLNYLTVDTLSLAGNDPCRLPPNGLCVDVGEYSTTVTLPYNPAGYYFVYQRCCRNEILNNVVSPAATGATFYVFMSGAAQQACNSSPVWTDYPPTVICLGQPLVFDHSAADTDGDLVVYHFCEALQGADSLNPYPPTPPGPPYFPVEYTNGYSPEQPMGGNPLVAIDQVTGLIAGTPDHLGHFAIGVCGQEFRNGVLMSEIRRDIQFIVSSCNQSVIETSLAPSTLCDTVLSALNIVVENGTAPYAFAWSNGATTEDLPLVTPGDVYTVSITDAAGCTAQVAIRGSECVWPGDADYNGTADNFDILAIGQFFGDNGPVRPNASHDWTGQPGPYWSDIQPSGVNTKHVDCDGSGSVNVFDAKVVEENYNAAHPTAYHPLADPSAPELTIDIDLPYFIPIDFVNAAVYLGDSLTPAEDVYGIAFTIECDPPEAITTTPVWNFNANWTYSIFGDENHTVRIAKSFPNEDGRAEVAICNTRRLSFPSLQGYLGTFSFQLSSDIPSGPVTFSLTNVRLINAQGEVRPVNAGSAVLGISGASEAVDGQSALRIVPNPARKAVTLYGVFDTNAPMQVELFDVRGRCVFVRQMVSADGSALAVDLPEWPAGVYSVRVLAAERVFSGKIVVEAE